MTLLILISRGISGKLTFDAGFGDRLGQDYWMGSSEPAPTGCVEEMHTCDIGSVCLERNKHVGRSDVVRVGDLLDNLVAKQGRLVRAQWRVTGANDALRFAEIDQILLRTRPVSSHEMHISTFTDRTNIMYARMEFDLINRRNHLRHLQQSLKKLNRKVGNAYK